MELCRPKVSASVCILQQRSLYYFPSNFSPRTTRFIFLSNLNLNYSDMEGCTSRLLIIILSWPIHKADLKCLGGLLLSNMTFFIFWKSTIQLFCPRLMFVEDKIYLWFQFDLIKNSKSLELMVLFSCWKNKTNLNQWWIGTVPINFSKWFRLICVYNQKIMGFLFPNLEDLNLKTSFPFWIQLIRRIRKSSGLSSRLDLIRLYE